MSRYTIFNLRTDVNRKLSTSISSASLDFFGAIDEGRRNMKKKINPPEMARKYTMEDALYGHVNEYAVPEEMSYDNVIQIDKLETKRGSNVDTLENPMRLTHRKNFWKRDRHFGQVSNVMSISYTNGLKTASIHSPTGLRPQQQMLNNMDSLNDNGTFTVGGNIGALKVDNLNRQQGKGSFSFEIDGSGTSGFIQTMDMKPFKITSFLERGAFFERFFTSLPLEITSISLSVYSSPTDFYRFTVNGPHNQSTGFLNGWNQLKFLIQNGGGNPNPDALIGFKLEVTTTGNNVGLCRFDELIVRNGEVYEITFESRYCIIDPVTQQWIQRATKGTDELVFEDDSYDVFVLEVALALMKELYANGSVAKADISSTAQDLLDAYSQYFINHPSEVVQPTLSVFDFTIPADTGRYNGNTYGFNGPGED